jgi:hypothetical protein
MHLVNFRFFNRFLWFNKKKSSGNFLNIKYSFLNNLIKTETFSKNKNNFNFFIGKGSSLLNKKIYTNYGTKNFTRNNNIDTLVSSLDKSDYRLSVKDSHWTKVERFET